MNNTDHTTDFWHTFINSLNNRGFSYGKGELEMDEDTQKKLLSYLKEKIEEGVTEGETALPPGLNDYFWRFPIEILPKTRELTETFLKSNPENGVASVLRTIVELSDWDTQNNPHIDESMSLAPNDPGMNLVILDEFRQLHIFDNDIEESEKVLRALENLYTWATQQDNTLRYQEARSSYYRHEITPYAIYRHLKDGLSDLTNHPQNSSRSAASSPETERYKSLIKRCRDLVPLEKTAFKRYLGQQTEDQQDLVDAIPDHTDIWEAYLKSLENSQNRPPRRLTQNDQEQILDYLKAKIEGGVVDGKTTLPTQLYEHISDLPEAMLLELREFAEEILETQPENGAAAKIIAIIVWEAKRISRGESDSDLTLLEQAMVLADNDIETCFYAIKQYIDSFDPFFKLTLTALERLFEKANLQDEHGLYDWLTKLYRDVGRTPCHIYRNLVKNPDANAELISRCKPLIDQMQQTFQQRLTHEPDDWYALRGLGDVYEVLGEDDFVHKYQWEPHTKHKWKQETWIGKKLPNFSATAIDGSTISFTDYHDKMLVLNFCAKSCSFCAPEIPYLKKVYEEHHDEGFEVIGVSLDKNEAELRDFTQKHNIPWIQVYDGKGWKTELAQFFGINSLPSQWLIDRDGNILSVGTRGEQLSQLVKWSEATRIGNEIPDFTAVDVDGNPVSPAALRGKVVLLHFGHIHNDPELKQINTLYKKHHKDGFDVIGINVIGWKDEEALRGVVRRGDHQGHYIYADNDGEQAALAEQFGFGSGTGHRSVKLPAFILIDTEGKVIDARAGKVHSPEAWAAKLEELVAAHL